MVAIEESKDLSEMKLEELKASLEAHEMRLEKRDLEKDYYYNKNNDEYQGVALFSHDGSSEFDDVILMDATHLASEKVNVWYLDTSCNNDIIGNKNWVVKVDELVRRLLCFGDNNMVTLEGMSNIGVENKDDHEAIISDVSFVPSMASNLITLGLLLDKNYTTKL
ncbi:uncharacterized protein LOC131605512 [Vicia villosa]|uniref:uncharacterized protein LOC131605512 n=1 Tax=Vicia villosa TaxID=3911 RepID=UPI00273B7E55|nr:uncharacterized protein LOC131605512 [Vicia villosa]